MPTEVQKKLLQRVVNVFETGTPDGRYDLLVIYADGKNNSRQITFGRSQTTEQGNLRRLLQMYIDKGGSFAAQFQAYLPKVGKVPLVDDAAFKKLLVRAAREDQTMQLAQDQFFDEAYYFPAMTFCERNGFVQPLSALVIYDSYIHSGSVPEFLRKRFGEYTPANGGDEKRWVYSYVDTRHQWLKYHARSVLRATIYRTQCFKDQIAANNWTLSKLPILANGVKVS